jgi:hypothetical protein
MAMPCTKKPSQPEAKYTVLQAVAAAIQLSEQKPKVNPGVWAVLESDDELPVSQAQTVIAEIQQNITLKILRGQQISDFTQKILELIVDPAKKINRDWNVIAYVPQVHQDLVKQARVIQETAGSEFQGRIGATLELTARVLSCRYVASYGFYTTLLIDDAGNVYNFSPKNSQDEGKVLKIRGKVKAHKPDTYNNNTPTTYLNYVKIVP